ncbi:hypothetical protein EB796_025024 [Bugula neritina]|uniref:Uncharacterized protein n=1 Tax=Bugula neritina TaxID=10212 RepID=A0A7J7IS12_BUGNE|nr:hypothetical protein EB796_025024 [Bugula neritina]
MFLYEEPVTKAMAATKYEPLYLTIIGMSLLTAVTLIIILFCCKIHWSSWKHPEHTFQWRKHKELEIITNHMI